MVCKEDTYHKGQIEVDYQVDRLRCRFGRRIRLLIGRKYGVSVTELTLLSSGGIYFSIAALIVREGNKGSLYDFVDFSCFPLYMVGLFFASPLISLGLFPFCFVIV